MKPLTDLLRAAPGEVEHPPKVGTLKISGIVRDSRLVTPGSLFVAIHGEKNNGADFIPQAKQSGAVAVLCSQGAKVAEEGLIVIRAYDVRAAEAHMVAAFYGHQPAHMVAITGTDGKTSTADFFRQLWHGCGQRSASIGTLGVWSGAGKVLHEGSLTTPAPQQLYALLAELYVKKFGYAAMEASSHGLDQRRLDGVKLSAAAFTNIARDHLDYHETEEAYFIAKARLFSELLPAGKTAVLNEDDPRFHELAMICKSRRHTVIGFGKKGKQMRIVKCEPRPYGQRVEAELFGKRTLLDVPLVGAFQVMNIMAALGLVVATGGELKQALSVVRNLHGVPGRLEQVVQLRNGASVFVDYAHTPMALANILVTLRPHTEQKLHVVFGCGGDRDKGKRPQMGKIASQLADSIIVTDDNPRSEDAAAIRAAIMAQCPDAKNIGDRREAIAVALKALQAGDILVLAGKGHEKTQIIGSQTLPFDDAQVARGLVQELRL